MYHFVPGPLNANELLQMSSYALNFEHCNSDNVVYAQTHKLKLEK